MQHTVLTRFLKYVTIDTQSDPHSNTYPSTEKQKNLSRILVEELLAMGINDAEMDEFGYVYATIPSNVAQKVPVICFCSHVDTSPDCSGKDVKPIIHPKYDGADIVLPDDPTQIIQFTQHPDLEGQIGNDIITASGTTLLGADNKSGVAAIMDAAYQLMQHPEIPHGTIKILFTPDEEIGRGTAKVNLKKLGADFGYTIDGATLGSLEDETFSANGVTITIHGVSMHPGFAKGKLVNALKIAAEILAALPKKRLSPETTEGREGFIHPVEMSGIAEKATIDFIIRDFTTEKLQLHEAFLRKITKKILAKYPEARADFEVKEQYRNMKDILNQHPHITEIAMQAMKMAGLQPTQGSIRGGTDGSRLSYMGLPCPNIFAGEHAFHSKLEWVSRQDMEKAVETMLNIGKVVIGRDLSHV
jgi:tripeptide aminopeptidase